MIIDCHVHADNRRMVNNLLRSMELNAIDASVIFYFPLWKKQGYLSLEKLIPVVSAYPNLYLAGSIKMTDNPHFERDLEILHQAVQNRQVIAVKLYPGYEPFAPNDSLCDPIYRLCDENQIPVIFHSGDTWWLFPQSRVRFAHPLFIDDVAVRYPGLKILIAHLGNPWIRETAELVSKNRNVYTDMSGLLSPASHRFEARYTEGLRGTILDLVAYCGHTGKLLFGSDFPLYRQERYLDFFNSIPEFKRADRNRILSENAIRFFNLTVHNRS
jgi:hypothetical protein